MDHVASTTKCPMVDLFGRLTHPPQRAVYARPILYVMWLLIGFIKPVHKKDARTIRTKGQGLRNGILGKWEVGISHIPIAGGLNGSTQRSTEVQSAGV